MWGREKPSLKKSVQELERNIALTKALKEDITLNNLESCDKSVRTLVTNVTLQLKALRERIESVFHIKKRLIQSCSENPDNQLKYMRRISLLHQNSADCEASLKTGIAGQCTLLGLLAHAGNQQSTFAKQHTVDLSIQSNVFQLLPPEIMDKEIDLTKDSCSQYIKQGSELWHEQRKKAHFTGSTLYRALGLDTRESQKAHHTEFVLGRAPQPFTADIQVKLDHRLKHEKHVIAMLVTHIMRAFLLPCFAYFEVGPLFISVPERAHLIEVSPDGVLKCTGGENCKYRHMANHKTIALEVKLPYPSQDNPANVYYEIWSRNVPQVEAEMVG